MKKFIRAFLLGLTFFIIGGDPARAGALEDLNDVLKKYNFEGDKPKPTFTKRLETTTTIPGGKLTVPVLDPDATSRKRKNAAIDRLEDNLEKERRRRIDDLIILQKQN